MEKKSFMYSRALVRRNKIKFQPQNSNFINSLHQIGLLNYFHDLLKLRESIYLCTHHNLFQNGIFNFAVWLPVMKNLSSLIIFSIIRRICWEFFFRTVHFLVSIFLTPAQPKLIFTVYYFNTRARLDLSRSFSLSSFGDSKHLTIINLVDTDTSPHSGITRLK